MENLVFTNNPGLSEETAVWSLFYSKGFFGYGEVGDFKLGSIAHIAPIVLAIIIIVLIYRYREYLKKYKYQENIQYLLIFLMLFAEISFWCRLVYVGPGDPSIHTMMTKLPLQVCQYTLFITTFALITKSKTLFNMGFYMTTLPTLLAIAIVEVISTTGPTYFRYYQFWLEHLVPVISIYYMMFVLDFKPELKYVAHTMTFLSAMFIVSTKADAFVPEGLNKYMYKNFINKIPLFKNADVLGEFIVCFIGFSLFFIFAYYVYSFISKLKANNKI